MRKLLLVGVCVMSLIAGSSGAAGAAVPASGIYSSHNGVLYSTYQKPYGCRYSMKANLYSEPSVQTVDSNTREADILGLYTGPSRNCHVIVHIRFWHPTKGIEDVSIHRTPGQSGDIYVGKTLGEVGKVGWKFVYFHVTVYPAVANGVALYQSQVGVVYDANPCIKYPAVCSLVSEWKKYDGIVRV